MDSKALSSVEIKDADQGRVTAVFSTFNVVDSDGDITVKDAIKDGTSVRISAYNHGSWQGALPVGKGVIRNMGNQAVLEGQFFMNTTHGRDTFEVVKQLADQQQWSYGFDVVDFEQPDEEAKSGGAKRILKELNVHEVSPVMIGAGVGTRTVAVKAKHMRDDCEDPECEEHPTDDEEEMDRRRRRRERDSNGKAAKRSFSADERRRLAESGKAMPDGSFPVVNKEDLENAIGLAGHADNPAAARRHIMRRARALGAEDMIPDDWKKQRFTEEGKDVLASVKSFRERAAEVMAMRAQKGQQLGEESRELFDQIREELMRIEEILHAPEEKQDNSAQREWLRSIANNL